MTARLPKSLGQNLCWVAIALAAFVGTSTLIHSLLPPMIPKGVAAKLKYFTEHKDEFDTVIVGTSHLYYSVAPEIFDATTGAHGLTTHTFNFGIDGLHPPENFYLLEQILQTKPRNLKWVLLELADIQTKWAEILGTQRAFYWRDGPRTWLMLKKSFNPRGEANRRITLRRIWRVRSLLISNLTLLGKRFANVGRAADFLPQAKRERFADAATELGPRGDGYRWAGEAMPPESAASFQQRLTEEISRASYKYFHPATEAGYRRAAAKIRDAGAAPVFVVTPSLSQTTSEFRQSPPPAPILAFNNARKYPQLYDVKIRIDDGHLTGSGAENFCRALAEEFVRRARER